MKITVSGLFSTLLICLLSLLSYSQILQANQPVVRGTPLVFPRDHGPHPQQSIEWWYLTANLKSASGKHFGVQWTLFRTRMDQSKLKSSWWNNQLYFSHFAIEDDQSHMAFERFARTGQAEITHSPFMARIDHWSLKSQSEDFLPLKLTAKEGDYGVQLSLNNSPRVLHGDKGFSQKTEEGHASYYYSYPLLEATGSITLKGEKHQVTGSAWYDREWSSGLLGENYSGWDWFSIQKSPPASGALMVFCLRDKALEDKKQKYRYCSGSDISETGRVDTLSHQDIQLTATKFTTLDNHQYPVQWQLSIQKPSDLTTQQLTIQNINKDSRNPLSIPYWEGRIRVSGDFNGRGYVELTGY